jgi:hypothetical protein
MLLFTEFPPIQPGFKWAWKLGILVGILIALAVAFLLWLYFVTGVFLILSLFGTVPNFAPITRVVGLSFFFLFLGRSLTIVLQFAGLSLAASPWVYSVFLIWALLAMAYGLKSALRIPVTNAGIAVVVPMIIIELLSLWLRDVVADNFYGGGSTMVAKTPVTKLTTVFMARYFGI